MMCDNFPAKIVRRRLPSKARSLRAVPFSARIAWLIGCALFALSVSLANASQEVTLAWDYPDPPGDLEGFRVYLSFAPIPDTGGSPLLVATVQAGVLQATVQLDALPAPGAVVYFRATAYDTSGNESALSNEVSKDFLPPHTLILRFGP